MADTGSAPESSKAQAKRVYLTPGRLANIFGLCVVFIILGALSSVFYFVTRPSPPVHITGGSSTEAAFSADVVSSLGKSSPLLQSSVFNEEWPAVRSVHKLIAYTIARCHSLSTATMERPVFDALLLDLRPDGGHAWLSAPAGDPERPERAVELSFEPMEQTVLALSDSVSRARLAAVRGADNFYPDMIRFGWATVIVSALATMFVTLKSAVSDPDPAPPNSSNQALFGWQLKRFWIGACGALAILLSTTTTILASAKQFWDPTAAYMRNESALVALRQLHEEIALDYVSNLGAQCRPANPRDFEAKLVRSIATLVTLQPGIMSAPLAIPAAAIQGQVTVATQGGRDTSPTPPVSQAGDRLPAEPVSPTRQ